MDLVGVEGGFSSICEVEVEVIDINDYVFEFIIFQIGFISFFEDVEFGILVVMFIVIDVDFEFVFCFMDFVIERGDMGGIFDLDWEFDFGYVGFRFCKNFSYEVVLSYKVVVVVWSVVELVGLGLGFGVMVIVIVLVERVMLFFKLDQECYEVSVFISVLVGFFLLIIQFFDFIS